MLKLVRLVRSEQFWPDRDTRPTSLRGERPAPARERGRLLPRRPELPHAPAAPLGQGQQPPSGPGAARQPAHQLAVGAGHGPRLGPLDAPAPAPSHWSVVLFRSLAARWGPGGGPGRPVV